MSLIISLAYHGRVLSKKNSKRIITNRKTGTPMMVSNPAAKANEDDMVERFRDQAIDLKLDNPVAKCKILITIYEPDYQKRDLDNQATSILDALVSAEVIVDDSIKCVKELTVRLGGIDAEEPRALVMIVEEQDNG